LKTNIAISALFTAAAFLTPAYATTTLFTSTSLSTNANGICLLTSSGATSCTGATSAFITTPAAYTTFPTTVSGTPANPYTLNESSGKTTASVHNGDLGVGTSGEIPFGDFVVLDFANAATYNGQSASSVDLNMNIVAAEPAGSTSYWVVYGLSSPTSTAATLLAYGKMPTTGAITSADTSFGNLNSLSYSNSYAVGVMGDCAIDISSMSVTYPTGTTTQQTPEPGTFVMAGMALIGLGWTMKKRNRKSII
jgi:hypothetical protein